MSLVFHERVGLDDRRISPFSWRIRYALAHKALEPEVVPTRFADVGRIRALSGQDLTPVLEQDGVVVHDSWQIACHLEDRFPDRPTLFGGPEGRGAARLINIWADTVLALAVRRLIVGDFVWCLDPGDRAYYRRSREAQYGTTLETVCPDRDQALADVATAAGPLERTLREQAFVAGTAPAYVDYVIFSVFLWARIGSPGEILPAGTGLDAVRAWRERMIHLHGGVADRFGLYPEQRSGPDGRC